MGKIISLLSLLVPTVCFAQSYSIAWYKVAGGGGASVGTNGSSVYSISGTIGQQEGGNAMTGGSYSMTGGFWSLIGVTQTAGLPNLSIQCVGPGRVVVSWPDTGSYVLQQNSNLASTPWAASGYTVATAEGTNSITITPPIGSLFFRLANH